MSRNNPNFISARLKTARITPSKITQVPFPDLICRICMDHETDQNKFISPCNCIGTVKFVHEECLKTWIVSTSQDLGSSKCELCKSEFEMIFSFSKECNIYKSCSHGWGHFVYIPILFLIMVLMFVIIVLMSTHTITLKTDNNSIGYQIALMVSCGVVGLFLILIIYSIIKDICIVKKIDKWTIASKVAEKEGFALENESSETLIHEMNLKHALKVPENVLVNGERVQTPNLNPNLEQDCLDNQLIYSRKESSCVNSFVSFHHHSNSDPNPSHFVTS